MNIKNTLNKPPSNFPASLNRLEVEVLDVINLSENATAVHIRRGDKANNPQVFKIHGLCPLGYYQKALEILKQKCGNLTCFVFSDDIKWAKENLHTDCKTYFIDHNTKEEDSVWDVRLMSACEHHVICNSSFSWWGSYLSSNKGVTIAPDFWVKNLDFFLDDIFLPEWVRLSTE